MLGSNSSGDSTFAAQHPWDRNFFLAFILACWLGVIMGFAPAVIDRFSGRAGYPASMVLQVHAIVFPAWMVIITCQILLIRTHQVRLHQTLGLSALGLIPVMTVTGVWSEILSQRVYSPNDPLNQAFFIIPLAYMVMFPAVAGAAIWFRRAPSTHKRLILLATTTIVSAAYSRWWNPSIAAVVGDGYIGMMLNSYMGFYLIAGAAMLYDFVTRGRVHPVYLITVPALIFMQAVASYLYHSPDWLPVARRIAGI
jgi:hypothetical protein